MILSLQPNYVLHTAEDYEQLLTERERLAAKVAELEANERLASEQLVLLHDELKEFIATKDRELQQMTEYRNIYRDAFTSSQDEAKKLRVSNRADEINRKQLASRLAKADVDLDLVREDNEYLAEALRSRTAELFRVRLLAEEAVELAHEIKFRPVTTLNFTGGTVVTSTDNAGAPNLLFGVTKW